MVQYAAAEQTGVVATHWQIEIEDRDVLGEHFLDAGIEPFGIPAAQKGGWMEACGRDNGQTVIATIVFSIRPAKSLNENVSRSHSTKDVRGILSKLIRAPI